MRISLIQGLEKKAGREVAERTVLEANACTVIKQGI
jgi:hypothetical protein